MENKEKKVGQEKESGKGKTWKNKILLALSVLLMITAIFMIFNKQITGMVVDNMTEKTLTKPAGANYKESIEKAKKEKDVSFEFDDVQEISLGQVLKAQMDKNKPNSIGIVSVPEVNMQLPIMYGVSNKVLSIGAGTMKENMPMGKRNYVLAGHNVRNQVSLFSPLTVAKVGMKAYVTDYEKVYEYKIDKRYIVQPTQVDVINDHKGKNELTLITCIEKGTKRLITHANLVSVYNIDEAPKGAFHEEKKK